MRLDVYLFENFGLLSRNKASELIKSKQVLVNSQIVDKPSFDVNLDDVVEVINDEMFVSRAAYKLKHFLDDFDICVQSKAVLDIGSSTGGFAQVLLQKNASQVVCVDVGSNQLHPILKQNPNISFFENTDIRDFLHEPFEFVTCDVSFVSVTKILDDINRLSSKEIIILFKPQFEVGIDAKRDKNGVVVDKNSIAKAQALFFEKTSKLGWILKAQAQSKLAGKEGNVEEFYYFEK